VPAQVPSSNFMSLEYLPSAANPFSWHSWIAVPFAEKTRWPNFSFSGVKLPIRPPRISSKRMQANDVELRYAWVLRAVVVVTTTCGIY
jgi:hypothetical protein